MTVLLDAAGLSQTLDRMASEIAALLHAAGPGALVGIRRRGDVLADRIAKILTKKHRLTHLPLGALDITLYRDDLAEIGPDAVVRETLIDFPIANRTIILIDDVLHTGRTIRAAMTSLADLGRPAAVRLAVLCDRPGHELPIRADVVGLPLEKDREVTVHLQEIDGTDEVLIA
jgi:pyrimidine operon attenuation protein/uracil phosphoribosyltransferase